MPNRIIKESICSSEDVDKLTPEEEVFFYRLITQVDDYGRIDARPRILRSRCFPLRVDIVTDIMIQVWLKNLVSAGLIKLYTYEGKPYLQLITWEKHQRIRTKVSKYPDPDEGCITDDDFDDELQQFAADCGELQQNAARIQNPESNPNPESIIESKEESEIKKSVFVLPSWINNNLWADFLEMRKKQKRYPTDRAKIELVSDLEKLKEDGENIDEVILKSVKNNWLGFYSLKDKSGGKVKNKSSPDPDKYTKGQYGKFVQH